MTPTVFEYFVMQIIDIITPKVIRSTGKISSKKRLFHTLAEISHDVHKTDVDRVISCLQDREDLGPTGVGDGVALPHARLPDVNRVSGIFIRLDTPLEFGAADRQPVDLIFALLAPEQAGVEHLKALALVARSLRNKQLCAKLRANTDPSVLYAILTEAEASQAA